MSLWLPEHMAGPYTPALSSPCPLDAQHAQELSWAKGPVTGGRAGNLVAGLPRVHSGFLLMGWQMSTAGQEPSLKCQVWPQSLGAFNGDGKAAYSEGHHHAGSPRT